MKFESACNASQANATGEINEGLHHDPMRWGTAAFLMLLILFFFWLAWRCVGPAMQAASLTAERDSLAAAAAKQQDALKSVQVVGDPSVEVGMSGETMGTAASWRLPDEGGETFASQRRGFSASFDGVWTAPAWGRSAEPGSHVCSDGGALLTVPETGLFERVEAPQALEIVPPPWTLETMSRILMDHGVPVQRWTTEAKEIFLAELVSGKVRLRNLVRLSRVMDMVLLYVEMPQERLVLQQVSGGSSRFTMPERSPATRVSAKEEIFQAARRLLQRRVGIDLRLVRIHEALERVWDTTENTDSMPGLASVVRKFLVRVEVIATDARDLRKLGLQAGELSHTDSKGARLLYKWAPQDSALGLLTHVQKRGTASFVAGKRSSPSRKFNKSMERIACDEHAEGVLPWGPKAVMELCEEYGAADVAEHFGHGLPELAKELAQGLSFFAVRRRDRRLLLMRDIVCPLVRCADGQDDGPVCVVRDGGGDADGEEGGPLRLPWKARMADEHYAMAAIRAVRAELGLMMPTVVLKDGAAFEVAAAAGRGPPPAAPAPPSLFVRLFVVPATLNA